MNKLSRVLVVAAFDLATMPAGADVAYYYSGAALDITTTFGSVSSLPTQVTGELVATAPVIGGTDPLGGPLVYNLSQFVSWSFSDGLTTLSSATAGNPSLLLGSSSGFMFDSTGQIENWFVSLNEQPVFIPGTQSIIETIGAVPTAGPQPCLSVVGLPPACYADDGQAYNEVPPPGVGASGVASATTARGQWSGPQPIGVPEPDGLLLALTGFALVACLRLASVPSRFQSTITRRWQPAPIRGASLRMCLY